MSDLNIINKKSRLRFFSRRRQEKNVEGRYANNKRLVRKEYSIEKMVKNLNDIYKQV